MNVVVRAPAKLTLSLRITGIRDDGYHLIDAEMVTISLADELLIAPGNGLVVIDEVGSGLPVHADPENLVSRALDAVRRQAHVTLYKRVPAGAGLGGGSADAAAVLRWAGCTDRAVARRLGADVTFCLLGGHGRVRGIGDQVETMPPIQDTYTLLVPPLSCSTPAVYRAWDDLGGPTSEHNDLERAALVVAPDLAKYRDQLGDATGIQPRLAGSGSTWFVPGSFPGEGLVVVQAE